MFDEGKWGKVYVAVRRGIKCALCTLKEHE